MPTPDLQARDLPFDPLRTELYSPDELLSGSDGTLESTRDYAIYQHFSTFGRRNPSRNEAYVERLHDWSIDEALRRFLAESSPVGGSRETTLVAVMGGHGKSRSSSEYRCVAQLSHELAHCGITVASGGGPGIMEATNLGASLASYPLEAVDEALALLSVENDYRKPEYLRAARQVLERFPIRTPSLAVPTWFYGHEPTNLFGTAIAKYFSNGLREDTLLAIAKGGVVFAPGKAGTWQEIFMDLAQNFYKTFDVVSPMVFLGRDHYESETGILPVIRKLVSLSPNADELASMLHVTDDALEAVAFLRECARSKPTP